MSCLLLRKTCESEEAANAAHTGGSENRGHNDEVLPQFEFTYNEAEGRRNQLLAASLDFWNTEEYHSDLLTREINTYALNGGIAGVYRPGVG